MTIMKLLSIPWTIQENTIPQDIVKAPLDKYFVFLLHNNEYHSHLQ